MCTATMHDPKYVVTVNWDECHTVKVCKQCSCTISEIQKIRNRPKQVIEPFYGRSNEHFYTTGRSF